MKIDIITFTDRGTALAERIRNRLRKTQNSMPQNARNSYDEITVTARHAADGLSDAGKESLHDWTARRFAEKSAIVVIGACGIAVRMIAPFVADKREDSPVVVADEAGNFVIPLLSGHIGGAEELAGRIAAAIGAVPVPTAATDVNGTFAVDVFAKKSRLTVENKEGIAKISSKILDGKTVDIVISPDCTDLSHGILRLKPKEYVLGVGCRGGKSYDEFSDFLGKWLAKIQIAEKDVYAVASADLKKEEACIVRWCASRRIPFLTFPAEELARVPGTFTESAFVKEQTGVGNVCERAALLACGADGKLVLKKQAECGMTLAVAKRPWKFEPEKLEDYCIE